jgi:putative membrane protein
MGIHNMLIILTFACGIVTGLAAFTRFLRWLLSRVYNSTLAFLVGLIAGSLRRIWPWKGEAIIRVINGKDYVVSQANALPGSFSGDLFFSLGLILAGAAAVIILERLARQKEETGGMFDA